MGKRGSFFVAALFLLLVSPPLARASGIIKPPTNLGLVGYWSMDDCQGATSTDFSGSGNTGSLTNFALSTSTSNWVTGNAAKRGCALDFDGSNDFVSIPDANNLDGFSAFTISFWIKIPATPTSLTVIMSKWGATGTYELQFPSNSKISFFTNADSQQSFTSSSSISVNVWTHVVARYNGSTMNLYFNGVQDANSNSANTGSIKATTNLLNIGRSPSTLSNYTRMAMDDVRMYNRALSAAEVSYLYNSGSAKVKATSNNGLVGYWSMDDCRGATSTDFSGNGNTGSLTNFALSTSTSNWVTGNAAKRGCALNFDGVDDFVGVPDATSLRVSNLTLSAWFQLNGGSGQRTIISKEKSSGNWSYGFNINPSGNLEFFTNASGVDVSYSFSLSPKSGTWYHVVATYNGSNVILYLNGNQVTSPAVSGAISYDTSALHVGRYNAAFAQYFPGSLDDVRIYNRALSASDVTALYNSGATKVNVSSNKLTAGTSLASGLVGHWTFDGQYLNTTTSTDTSGQGNDGTLTNGPVPTIGKLGQALNFDGSNDFVNIGGPSSLYGLSTDLSVFAWIKTTDGSWDAFNNGHGDNGGWGISSFGIGGCTAGKLQTFIGGAWRCGSTLVNNDTWHYAGYTLSSAGGGTLQFYVDGAADGSAQAGVGSHSGGGGLGVRIGNDSAGFPFAGSIDDARIYNRALSADEVLKLYDLGR